MCGRYSLTTAPEAMRRLFRTEGPLPNWPPRYNIAPTQAAPVVRRRSMGQGNEIALLRWGLVPSWSKGPDPALSMINARAETVATKPAYRAAFRQRRCLVPTDGFFEWQKLAGGGTRPAKQPYHIRMKDGAPFAFAGLWEHWQGGDGSVIESFTIIVTDANELVRPIHDRMPVVLDPSTYDHWLEPKTPSDLMLALLRPFPARAMTAIKVSTRVNSPRNDDAACIEPAA
jgi:putative SOS response-associated peptidase YedK